MPRTPEDKVLSKTHFPHLGMCPCGQVVGWGFPTKDFNGLEGIRDHDNLAIFASRGGFMACQRARISAERTETADMLSREQSDSSFE